MYAFCIYLSCCLKPHHCKSESLATLGHHREPAKCFEIPLNHLQQHRWSQMDFSISGKLKSYRVDPVYILFVLLTFRVLLLYIIGKRDDEFSTYIVVSQQYFGQYASVTIRFADNIMNTLSLENCVYFACSIFIIHDVLIFDSNFNEMCSQ